MSERLFINHMVDAQPIEAIPQVLQTNPSDPNDLTVFGPEADDGVVEAAVGAAEAALPALSALGAEGRSDLLMRIAARIEINAEQLAQRAARETGKTVRDARSEAERAVRIFRFFAGESLRNVGEAFESTRGGVDVRVNHVPIGVVGVITPWNFPLAIPAWKLAPALGFANGVVWKPSERATATADLLMTQILDAAPPRGSVNMIVGAGPAGQRLCAHPRIKAVSFTGSERAGAKVAAACTQRGAPVQLEMGGVNGMIVADDANLDLAVDAAINGAFYNAGQRCTATSRLIVMQDIAEAFTKRFRQRAASLTLGDARTESTDIGPLVSLSHKRAALEALNRTRGRSLLGDADPAGAFMTPRLYTDVTQDDVLAQEEVFAPVAALFVVDSFDAALHTLNATRFGLSASVFTRSLTRAHQFLGAARAGVPMVNLPTAGIDYHAPFGGLGASSYGPREQGRAARNFYTTSQTAYVRRHLPD